MRSFKKRWMRPVVLLAVVGVLAGQTASSWADTAEGERQQRGSITITSDKGFTAENGVRSGSGTKSDPYVFSGWQLSSLRISDTDSYLVIKDNKITGQLVLNWNGDRVRVVRNEIGDLRVNQNVRRTGDMTSGVIRNNRFGVVGQLRHWNGIFENNYVGDPDLITFDVPLFGQGFRAVNFDGWNGAHFRHNVIDGWVEVRLHGHHHSSGFGEPSHYHGAPGEHAAHTMDHTKRYHEVWVSDNVINIHDQARYALVYTDTNHAGNDRTAASEQNEELNKPHEHWTRMHFTDNELNGAGIAVDIFNSSDQNHVGTNPGRIDIQRNRITLNEVPTEETFFRALNGIELRQVTDATIRVSGNRIAGPPGTYSDEDIVSVLTSDFSAGLLFRQVDHARIVVTDNQIQNRMIGLQAERFGEEVTWVIRDLRFKGVARNYQNDGTTNPRSKT